MEQARILVVEDDELVARDISLKLSQHDYDVVANAASGADAVRLAEALQPDLVLMDIILAGDMDGIEAAGIINSKLQVPIIYLTAYDDEDFLKRAKLTTPFGYVLKPCSARELHAAVSIALFKSGVDNQLTMASQMSATLAGMSDPVIGVDPNDRVVMLNKAASSLLGAGSYHHGDISVCDLVQLRRPGKKGNKLTALLEKLNQPGRKKGIYRDRGLWLHPQNGDAIPVSVKIDRIHTSSEVGGGAVILLQDISRRVAIESELQLAEEVFRNTSEGILVTDTRPRILRVNDAYLRITGYDREEVIGKNPSILQSGYHNQDFYRDMWQELLETGVWAGELWNRRKDGEVFPEFLTISSAKDERGRVTGYIGVFADISVSRDMQQRLHYMEHFDNLTGLSNRGLFEERLAKRLSREESKERSLALLLIDIDDFNTINDTAGHTVGDRLLVEYAERIVEVVGQQEAVARFGGDIFAVMMEEVEGGPSLFELAEVVLDVLSTPVKINDAAIQLTASIGISTSPGDGRSVTELLKLADTALHYAKNRGKNTFQLFNRAIYDSVLAHRQLERDLRQAVEKQQLQLLYQPQVDVKSGRLIGCEALIRWHRSAQELVPPNRFIPLAEETGQIIEIGHWVLEEACRQYTAWCAAGVALPHMAVNISPRQLYDPDFVAMVSSTLDEFNMDPSSLMLEVTESIAITEQELCLECMRRLKEIGVQLSLDDFGTGYSALSSLQHYPFDVLKIDRSFIISSQSDQHGAVILESIIRMGNALDLETIAEGVEEQSQIDYLKGLGCRYVQGYYYSKPVAAESFASLVKQGFGKYQAPKG